MTGSTDPSTLTQRSRPGDQTVALVTGGAQGIGAGVARRLADQGARVVVADVAEEAGQTVAQEIDGHFSSCDVSQLDQLQRSVDEAVDRFGGLDVVHLNAGIVGGIPAASFGTGWNMEQYRQVMKVNVDGVVLGVVAAMPALQDRGGGDIVATASLAGLTGTPFDPLYGLGKHAVVGLVRSLGPALLAEQIRINALCPGFARTAIIGGGEEIIKGFGVRLLEVDEVVDAFMTILQSKESGQCWYVQPDRPPGPFQFQKLPGPGPGPGTAKA